MSAIRLIKKIFSGIAMGAAAALLSIALWHTGALDRLEYPTWNWRVNALAEPSPSTERIALILLDQDSLDWGKESFDWSWPWPREIYTTVIEFCRRGGARGIAFDILYTEPSVYGAADDAALGRACAAGTDVVGSIFLGNATGDRQSWPDDYPEISDLLDVTTNEAGRALLSHSRAARGAFPIPEYGTNVALLANVSDQPDADGVFRRASLVTEFAGHMVPSLGAALWALDAEASGAEDDNLTVTNTLMTLGGKRVPLDAHGHAIVRFRGPSQTHLTRNAAAVIKSELMLREGAAEPLIDPSIFKDRYVLFGFSAPGLLDQRTTPVGNVYPGVEIHANVLDNLLEEDFLRDPDPVTMALLILCLAMGAGACVRLCTHAWQTIVAFAVLLPVPFVHGFLAYGPGVWWPIAPDFLAVLVSVIGAIVINYATEGRQKAFIKQAFRHYLSADVIEKIIRDPSKLKLGGERRELTIFFSDLQGFSSISETMDAEQLTALLNDYLTDMTDIILESGGTLDKYEGDAIVAFWNAPMNQPDHAQRACRAALDCSRKLASRRAEYMEKYGAELKMRIGLNTGEVVVGNMGSHNRFNYTVLGDAANLASRLEGANKVFGTWIMVSDSTWTKAGGNLIGRFLGRIRVVGRSAPVTVYELFGAGALSEAQLESFQLGLDTLESGKLDAAHDAFELLPDDGASRIYAETCMRKFKDGETWDGIWNLTEK